MLKGNLWSLIYHEHLSYVTETSVRALLRGTGFAIQNVIHYPVHGGSVVFFIRRGEEAAPVMGEQLTLDDWKAFCAAANSNRIALKMLLLKLSIDGGLICGYGAPAKAAVICNALAMTTRHLAFVTDTTPSKVGCFIPGTDIPVVRPSALMERKPDYALLLAWNYADEILARETAFRERGGKFILPHTLEIV